MNDPATTIIQIIKDNVEGIEIDAAADMARSLKQLGIDSLDKMSILLAVQEQFDATFTEAQISQINSIEDMRALVAP